MKRVALLIALLLLAGSCGGGGAGPTIFTDRNARFDVEIGETIEVILESNASTGFGWDLMADLPPGVLQLVDERYIPPGSDVPGAAGAQVLEFLAIGNGSTFIQLWYVRPFDDPPGPADMAQFEVIVGTGDPGIPIDPREIDEPSDTTPDEENALDVHSILGMTGPVLVRGLLFEDETGMVLCETLAESFPPQCRGPSVTITNPAAALADFASQGDVRWTDRVVVISGEMVSGGLQISN